MNVCKCAHLSPQEKEVRSPSCGNSKMYTSGTIANSQKMPTEINKNDVIAKVKILVENVILQDI